MRAGVRILGAVAGLLLAAGLRAADAPAARLGVPVEEPADAALALPPGLLFGTPYPTDEFRPPDDPPGPRVPGRFSPLDAFYPAATLGWPYPIHEPAAKPEPVLPAQPRPLPDVVFDPPFGAAEEPPIVALFGDANPLGETEPRVRPTDVPYTLLDEFRPTVAFRWPYSLSERTPTAEPVVEAPRPRPTITFAPPIMVSGDPPLVAAFGEVFPAPAVVPPRPSPRATLGDPVAPAVEIIRGTVAVELPRIVNAPTLGDPIPSTAEILWLQPPDAGH